MFILYIRLFIATFGVAEGSLLVAKGMPLWSGNVMAVRGGGACVSRLCVSLGASSCHRKRRVDLGLALRRPGVVQSAQVTPRNVEFRCFGVVCLFGYTCAKMSPLWTKSAEDFGSR